MGINVKPREQMTMMPEAISIYLQRKKEVEKKSL
jgi:hypothetical protein